MFVTGFLDGLDLFVEKQKDFFKSLKIFMQIKGVKGAPHHKDSGTYYH